MKKILASPWLLVLPALVFFSWRLASWDFVVDDAYISFRYAKHFSEGQGLVFNPGEAPVEGYTNFLWTLLMAGAPRLGLSFVAWARALGIASALAAAALAAMLAAHCIHKCSNDSRKLDVRWSALAAALILINAPMVLWAGAGLEGPLLALLLSGAVLFALRCYNDPGCGATLGASLYLVLLSLCRPEATVLATLIGVFLLFQPKTEATSRFSRIVPIVAVIGVGAVYHAWRYKMYGDWLPNTFYAKVGFSLEQLARGGGYLWSYFGNPGGLLAVVLAVLGIRGLGGRPERILVPGLILASLSMTAVVGGDALPMYRFLVPVVPLLAVLMALGVAEVVSSLSAGRSPFALREGWLVVVVLAVSQLLPAFVGRQAEYVRVDRERMRDRVAIGRWLREHYPESTIALNAAGAIPFVSGMKAIDMLGLNDRHIARKTIEALGQGVAGHEKHDAEYVLSRRPEIIFIGRNELTLQPGKAFIWLEGDRQLLSHPKIHSDYRLVKQPIQYEFFSFYLRKDVPLP